MPKIKRKYKTTEAQRNAKKRWRELNPQYMRAYWKKNKEAISLNKKDYREKNKETISRQLHQWYLENKERTLTKAKRWRHENKEYGSMYVRKWRRLHPTANRAHAILRRAVQSGKVLRPDNCPECNKINCRIEGHHADYSKPLEVIWVCSGCHWKLERGINAS